MTDTTSDSGAPMRAGHFIDHNDGTSTFIPDGAWSNGTDTTSELRQVLKEYNWTSDRDYQIAVIACDDFLDAQRQRWEAETTQILDRLTTKATETKDVKTGAIRQTVGLGYILNERRNLAALDGERGKEQ